jgi:hypothetical protein
MTRDRLTDSKKECAECRTIVASAALYCEACGCKDFRPREHLRFASDAIAAFIGVIAVILFWLARS